MRAATRKSVGLLAVSTLALTSISITLHASPARTSPIAAGALTRRGLTFGDRVAAQEAIERVYLRHRTGALPATDALVPREVLERKVQAYLEQSAALELFWNQPVSAEALRRELERIARDTHFPDRLEEIYDALGRDAVLIQECFARPVLVDRIARTFQALDPSLHREKRGEIDDLARRLREGELDPTAPHPRRQLVVLEGEDGAVSPQSPHLGDGEPPVQRVSEAEFARLRAAHPARVGEVGPVRQERDAYVVTVVLSAAPDRGKLAVYRVPKVGWEEWLAVVRPRLNPDQVGAVAQTLENLPVPGSRSGATSEATEACLANDTWDNRSLDDFPEGRLDPGVVWTGTEMIVWGGSMRSGARYDPLLDHWTILPRASAPSATGPAVWTGTEMVVWAGGPGELPGRYSPASNTWQPVSLVGAPTANYDQAAAWVGNRVVVWDAVAQQGGRYDPASDTWDPVSTVGAPSPRYRYAAVGAGNRLLIWGGFEYNGISADLDLNTGGQYDAATDVWTSTSTSGAPAGGEVSAVVWTGTRMIVWRSGSGGGMYDPGSNTWSAISTTGQPSTRAEEKAVWTGSQMVVWGGRLFPGPRLNDGARYDPATNLWAPTSTIGAPAPRSRHAAVWDGTRMIIWGGEDGLSRDSGGRYDPVTNAWTPVSQGSAPAAREGHAQVWTGSEMVIWGGLSGGTSALASGARYDPLTDSWTATTLAGAPPAAIRPYGFWTGHHLLVYGDYRGGNQGARYDPAADAWLPITAAGAPSQWSGRPAATWTGNRMFVIGWRYNGDDVAAFYNPQVNAWTPISLAGAPFIPSRGTVVWTGARAILFGGSNGSDGSWPGLGTMFDPVAGTWTMISQEGEPTRLDHEAIWTGDRMLVWGGMNHSNPVPGGGLYDPVADGWTPIAQPEWLPVTENHSLVWTGDRMIVWGGGRDGRPVYNGDTTGGFDEDKGGVYEPATDTWTPLTVAGAPAPRSWHGAVWTGGEMIIWGGSLTRTGGRYALGQADDRDGDGASFCAGDCDDADPAVHPGAAEICDGRDNDCDGVLLPAEGLDADLDLAPACVDCNDGDPNRYPGALELCDGIDNDCDGVANENDNDEDGRCASDCDDNNSDTYPGALEVNDGADNQCPGDPGFGIVDELSGSGMNFYGSHTLCWPGQAWATLYEVLQASNGSMSSGCVLGTNTSSCFTDLADPPSGLQYYYLIRPVAPHVGSWGVASSGAERTGLCSTPVFSFQDTAGDDVPSQALQQFLSGITVQSGDYLELSLHGPGIDFDLCTARADFYRASYLGLAPTSGTVSSGSWQKWSRTGGGAWVGPLLGPFENWFGDDCAGPYSWCAEVGLGGHILGVAPAEIGVCEAFDDIDCGDGTWTFSLRIGVDRRAACEF